MKSFAVLALMAVIAGCRLDTFFRGSGGVAPPVAGPPASLGFADQPQTTHARKSLPPVRVVVRDDQGNVVSGFGGLVSLTLDSSAGGGEGGGAPPGDPTTGAGGTGAPPFPLPRIAKAGTGTGPARPAPGPGLPPPR